METSQDTPEELELTPDEELALLEPEPDALPVTYSGQDFDVEGLVRRMGKGDILVPIFGHSSELIETEGFQRSFVWRRPQMDRFIESLLLGYPIPGIFFVKQSDNRYLVLDGQQRLRTLQYYYAGIHLGREFALTNVSEEFKDLTYKSLPETLRRRLDNTFFQATIVAIDATKSSLEAVYQIFERLNSGGTALTPHEIRVALYAGPFIDFLERLNGDESWRELYGKRSPRLRDQEIILRAMALYTDATKYRRPLKSFLNDFVGSRRAVEHDATEGLEVKFRKAAQLVAAASGRNALRPQGSQVNAALTEAIFVGLMRRLGSDPTPDEAAVRAAIDRIHSNESLVVAVSRATADEDAVRTRLEAATTAFAGA
ncbi:MAG: DUF262 domain-containing protein [Acidimicrobiia bacterium]